ncbi:LysR substrate-binding domain-containing protein [Defluviimonas sp. SAOS-178_SWC]|uniref:LysR substrate-binding domain-containing protein n=1 Tax=Defluviimonas sp. SAOS-178_SWC TaxID=3121287 RepID=UPI0032221AE4
MLKVSLRQISYFVAAAETGSIAEAARLANVAQPSVSWAILKMEELLDLELFVRQHAKGVSLTAAGHRLLPQARNLLRQAEDFEALARVQGHELTGTLTVGCYSTLAPVYLPRIIAEFARQHPRVKLEIHEDTVDDMLEKLTTGEIEVALAYDIDLPDEFLKLRIHTAPPQAVLPEGHRLLDRPAVSLAELRDEPFILLNSKPAERYFLTLFDVVGIAPQIAHTAQSFEVVRSLVGQGRGYSILVTRPLSDMTYDGIRIHYRPLTDELPMQHMCTVRAPTSRLTRRCQTFQDICVKLYSPKGRPLTTAS